MTRATSRQLVFDTGGKSLRRDANPRGRARSRTSRPGIDVLEDRVTPSTFYVTTTVDPPGSLAPGSLRWAVAQANQSQNQGSTVAITPLVKGTINLQAGEIPIRSSLTIENDSGNPVTILQATPNARIFHVFSNARTAAVTIAGQAQVPSGTLTLSGGQVVNGNGGAILVDNPADHLTLSNVTVTGNSAIQVVAPQKAARGERRGGSIREAR